MALGLDNDLNVLGALIAENTSILRDFAAKGVDLTAPLTVTFGADFALGAGEADAALTDLEASVDRLDRVYSGFGIETGLAGVEDEDIATLLLEATLVLEPLRLSVLEKLMGEVALRHGGGEVFWEFAEPQNDDPLHVPHGETLH